MIAGERYVQVNKIFVGSTFSAQHDAGNNENIHQMGYQQLLQQREEESKQEVERLTAEIRALKLQLLQLTSSKRKYMFIYKRCVSKFFCIPLHTHYTFTSKATHNTFNVRHMLCAHGRKTKHR